MGGKNLVYYSFSGRGTITPLIKDLFKPRSGSVYPPHNKPPLKKKKSGGKFLFYYSFSGGGTITPLIKNLPFDHFEMSS